MCAASCGMQAVNWVHGCIYRYQSEITFNCHKADNRRGLLFEQRDNSTHVPPDKCTHIQMVGDDGVVKANDLRKEDIYDLIQWTDKWRISRDLIFRLLVSEDEGELVEHVLGIIAAPGTTLTPSLLEQSYHTELTPRTLQVFWRIQNHKELLEFHDNRVRRTQLHFIIFVTMAIENEFCQYVVHHCSERDKLRRFINECVKPALARLLQGEMLTTRHTSDSVTAFGVTEFVTHCRFSYMTMCDVRPVCTGACTNTPAVCR